MTGSGSGGENVAGSGKGERGQTVAGRVLFPCEIILFSSEHDYSCLGTRKSLLLRETKKQKNDLNQNIPDVFNVFDVFYIETMMICFSKPCPQMTCRTQ